MAKRLTFLVAKLGKVGAKRENGGRDSELVARSKEIKSLFGSKLSQSFPSVFGLGASSCQIMGILILPIK